MELKVTGVFALHSRRIAVVVVGVVVAAAVGSAMEELLPLKTEAIMYEAEA